MLKQHLNLVTALVLVLSLQVNAQEFLRTQGQAIVNESGDTVLLRGMGLGGWMLQEGYMLQTSDFANAQREIRAAIEDVIGESKTEIFYDRWLANHMQRDDVDSLKSWGFNSVRLPMHYNLFTLPIEEEPIPGQHTWLNTGFELTDSLVEWCRANDMYVILDLHAAPGGQGYEQGISDYDPSKPSLWESVENRDKTVALWRRLAEYYADEPVIAGYDLINEPNWTIPQNIQLKNLYVRITNAIREVDQNHMLIIEGNWFANDFTGLTPPWDGNMVYSPHKYWSFNDQVSIQWVLDIRNQYNVPLYLGESGENSNTWFRDAIMLLENNGIGWAWWPLKKIEAIAGPLSIIKTEGYQQLLDYWKGEGPKPSQQEAEATLMDLTEKLLIGNCIYQKDVIDAMFRQTTETQPVPFTELVIPGSIDAVNYAMGPVGSAYFDVDVANYHVTTGNYTAWNQGWSYRNDGVDIEPTQDPQNDSGFNIGWTERDEWQSYPVMVTEEGLYNILVRYASPGSGGSFHFMNGDADISKIQTTPSTGGYQNWQTVTVSDVVLTAGNQLIKFYVDAAGFNYGKFDFVKTGDTKDISTVFISAQTQSENEIRININKPLMQEPTELKSHFELKLNGAPIPIDDVIYNPADPRQLNVLPGTLLKSSDKIKVSYDANIIEAFDGTILETFTEENVRNTLVTRHSIPGRIQAEDFAEQSGIQLENTTDSGGGQNIGYLDPGDYLEYDVDITKSGKYRIAWRTASLNQSGGLKLFFIEPSGSSREIQNLTFPVTGGWQTWTTTTGPEFHLPAGIGKLRIEITRKEFNINWFEFELISNTNDQYKIPDISIWPNPTSREVILANNNGYYALAELYDPRGQLLSSIRLEDQTRIDMGALPAAVYTLVLSGGSMPFRSVRVVKL